jgi:hypothetical protein
MVVVRTTNAFSGEMPVEVLGMPYHEAIEWHMRSRSMLVRKKLSTCPRQMRGPCQEYRHCQHTSEQVFPLSDVKIIFRAIFCKQWFSRLD